MATSGPLDPKVGDALLDDLDVVGIMQNEKVMGAMKVLKEDQSKYHKLVAEDPELKSLFEALKVKMEAKEKEKGIQDAAPRKMTMDSPAVVEEDVPPLEDAAKLECESARAAGTSAFEAGDYPTACEKYERATELEPHHAPHWTNLAIARLRGGDAKASAAAAREATRRNPRFAKAWLRLGEALTELGETTEAVEVFETGLKRAEGAVRVSLTKGLMRAKETAKPKPKPFAPSSGAASTDNMAAAKAAVSSVHGPNKAAPVAELPEKKPPKPLPTWEDEKLAIADEDEDEEEEEEAGAGLVIGPSLPPAYDPAATADATDAAAEPVEDPGNAESALGAALAQWSLNKPAGKVAAPAPASLDAAPASPRRAVESIADKSSLSSPFRLDEYTDVHAESPSRSSSPAPASQPNAPPKLPAFALSNDLIFDLA
ncbi:hypothetical protein Ctob_005098 [Chrysochromulina tobinii]|uniref:Uncharacterized protein n=1 Tax=Chrysochromulina tobinii TaxID=1460289 RepID=A0A0M0JQW1_9EUKA|nr:hypothetical protein Ctob_005098 [Chrysochromulina tobinii]|eukprot:KOO28648.1 hypothetical protein Ctob_005098 [Chrysochromulina sp. CCMP291]